MMNELQIYTEIEEFRLFEKELKKVVSLVATKKDKYGEPKYETKSHFYRSAVMKLLREETSK